MIIYENASYLVLHLGKCMNCWYGKLVSFILSLIRKSWMLWYIRKFKDAYLVMLCVKLIENLLTRMKLKTLQILWKLDYLRFFWNYLVINYVFEKKCIPMSFMWFWHNAMCDFPVITRFSFHSLCDNGIKSRLVPFHFGWPVLPYFPWGEEVPWLCVGEPMGPRDHMQERSYLTHSLCCPWGERKTLKVWVRLLSMGPRVCIQERTISCQLWMGGSPDQSMWVVWYICDNLPYVRYYGFGNYIVSAHRL